MALPININDLLGARTVESNRIEFKEGWNPDAIYRSICAFANDFDNGGGGYIIIGVAEEQGRAKRPVKGLTTDEIARIQREMIGYNNQLKPPYHPRLFIEEVDGQQILVLWVLGSSNRPHEVPDSVTAKQKTHYYYIRQYANSVRANAEQQQELIALTGQVPFDDRPNPQASLADISLLWIREYLRVSRARLLDQAETLSKADLLDQMGLMTGPPEHRFVRNAALMLFCEHPETFFPYTFIELVDFRRASSDATRGDKAFTEYTFRGPVQYQIRQLIDRLNTLVVEEMVIKVNYQPEAIRPWSYPPRVLEEAIANCIYHRDYQRYDPVRVFVHHDRIIFQNGGGPDRALRPEDFQTGRIQPRHYRNRRLGSFLKALDLTEGYATGIRLMLDEMAHNGSAPPVFSMDDDRTYFAVEFTLHPAFTESRQTPEKPQNGGLPGLKVLGGTDIDTLQKIFEQVFEQLAKREREEDRVKILALHPLSIQLLLNLGNQKTMNRRMLLESIEVTNQTKNAERYLAPLLELSAIEPTIKDRPQSSQQRYRLTEKGQRWVNQLNNFSASN